MIYKKIDISEIAFYNVSEDCAKAFIDYRIENKKKLTDRAFKLALKEAVLCGTLGLTPDETLDKTMLWGWQAPCYAYTANRLAEEFKAIASTMIVNKKESTKIYRGAVTQQELTDKSWAN